MPSTIVSIFAKLTRSTGIVPSAARFVRRAARLPDDRVDLLGRVLEGMAVARRAPQVGINFPPLSGLRYDQRRYGEPRALRSAATRVTGANAAK